MFLIKLHHLSDTSWFATICFSHFLSHRKDVIQWSMLLSFTISVSSLNDTKRWQMCNNEYGSSFRTAQYHFSATDIYWIFYYLSSFVICGDPFWEINKYCWITSIFANGTSTVNCIEFELSFECDTFHAHSQYFYWLTIRHRM